MIVCRRPWTLYDVDLAGSGAVLLLGLLTFLLVVRPLRDDLAAYRRLSVDRRGVQAFLERTADRLRDADADVARLEARIAALAGQTPDAGFLPRFVSRATALAEDAGLEVQQVVPHTTRAVERYLVADVQMSASGRSLDFIRFLDTLARESPYQSLSRFAIRRVAKGDGGRCALAWTIRVYMLPRRAPGQTPAPDPRQTEGRS